jgi:hypothetical protein
VGVFGYMVLLCVRARRLKIVRARPGLLVLMVHVGQAGQVLYV